MPTRHLTAHSGAVPGSKLLLNAPFDTAKSRCCDVFARSPPDSHALLPNKKPRKCGAF
jgi:hypothetical protein